MSPPETGGCASKGSQASCRPNLRHGASIQFQPTRLEGAVMIRSTLHANGWMFGHLLESNNAPKRRAIGPSRRPFAILMAAPGAVQAQSR